MKIKVCGMRDCNNISELVQLAPDYIGFIFYAKSKRFVTDFPTTEIPKSIKKVGVFVNESIENILNKISDFQLDVVQLHGDETPAFCEELKMKLRELKITVTERSRSDEQKENVTSTPLSHQKPTPLSHQESISVSDQDAMLNQVQHDGIQIIKAFGVGENFDFNKTKAYESSCDVFIFDTKGKEYGGNGVKYDWSILQNYKGEVPYLLSGGITDKDASKVIAFLRNQDSNQCIGVDLNSGFEESPALKNIDKLISFKQQLTLEDALVLKSEKVSLRILRDDDLEELHKTAADESIWAYFPVVLSEKEVLKKWISTCLELYAKHEWIPFVIIDNASNKIIGSTSFLAVAFNHQRVEIGATWITKELQGKGFNKSCKYVLLKYGFEVLNLERIEFKTDSLNIQSQKAIQKIGAVKEGVFRNHMTMPDNRRRDSVYFSIIKSEWKTLKNTIFKDIN